uniref:Uncharacterized protein n=1 Tax=Myoviridae sp. ctrMq22 TaxID=2825181 RepID=A0A8S5NUQ7_9CAUD|nr:MAG TPA: hypothetical protein [Myoviridae sp. ctrMq22]
MLKKGRKFRPFLFSHAARLLVAVCCRRRVLAAGLCHHAAGLYCRAAAGLCHRAVGLFGRAGADLCRRAAGLFGRAGADLCRRAEGLCCHAAADHYAAVLQVVFLVVPDDQLRKRLNTDP